MIEPEQPLEEEEVYVTGESYKDEQGRVWTLKAQGPQGAEGPARTGGSSRDGGPDKAGEPVTTKKPGKPKGKDDPHLMIRHRMSPTRVAPLVRPKGTVAQGTMHDGRTARRMADLQTMVADHRTEADQVATEKVVKGKPRRSAPRPSSGSKTR